MSHDDHQEYDEAFVNALELVWGEGYLSPGGEQEVARIVGEVDLAGKHVLDIGCGSGGIDLLLVEKHVAARVTGIDTEKSLIDKCRVRAAGSSDNERLEFIYVVPGPLPFETGHFDVVFTKDSLVHIEDKHAICAEVFRVLKIGGVFIASDWMKGPGPVTQRLQKYIDLEDLGFGMGSRQEYQDALLDSGFSGVDFVDRNAWYTAEARQEHRRLSGELYDQLVAAAGKKLADHEITTWKALVDVLERGEVRPTHWHAVKGR
jgi:SAM-dependent methyltransferase